MEFKNEQIFYIKNDVGHKIGCLAMGFYSKESVIIAGSLTSRNDVFSRKAARNIALGRLNSPNLKTRKVAMSTDVEERKGIHFILGALGFASANRYDSIDIEKTQEVMNECINYAVKEVS